MAMAMMHSFTARLNGPFFYGITVLGILAAISGLSVFFIPQSGNAELSNVQVTKLIKNTSSRWDEAKITFDLAIDLSQVWNWNTKLIFVWIEADYANPPESRNQVIIWDKIIWRNQYNPSQGVLTLKDNAGKYWMRTKDYDLRGTEVVLKVRWEVVPIVGINYKMDGGSVKVVFPSSYS